MTRVDLVSLTRRCPDLTAEQLSSFVTRKNRLMMAFIFSCEKKTEIASFGKLFQ
jgi:hypothetical protein